MRVGNRPEISGEIIKMAFSYKISFYLMLPDPSV